MPIDRIEYPAARAHLGAAYELLLAATRELELALLAPMPFYQFEMTQELHEILTNNRWKAA